MVRYSRKKGQNTPHRDRINKGKNYRYHNEEQVVADKGDEDLPGHGNFHCEICCRYFMTDDILLEHKRKSKEHKKQVKRQAKESSEQERMDNLLPSNKRKRRVSNDDTEMVSADKKAKN